MKKQGSEPNRDWKSPALAIAEALPFIPRCWKRRRVSSVGIKALLLLLTVLIGLPSPQILACACTEVVGGGGAVDSSLSVDNETGFPTLVQSDIKLPGIVPIELTRTYKSNNGVYGPFGRAWSVNMLNYLEAPDGSDIKVNFVGGVEVFKPSQGYTNAKRTMALSFTGPDEVTIFQRSGKVKWVFSLTNRTLKSYVDKNGNAVNYTWKVDMASTLIKGNIYTIQDKVFCPLSVTYPDGRQLLFSYEDIAHTYLCTKVTAPNGVVVNYNYTDGILTGVGMGGGQVLKYTYQTLIRDTETRGWLTKLTYTNAATVNLVYVGGMAEDTTKISDVYADGGYHHSYLFNSPSSSLKSALVYDSFSVLESFYSYTHSSGDFSNKEHFDRLGRRTFTINDDQNQPITVYDAKSNSTVYNYSYTVGNDYLTQKNLLFKRNPLGAQWNYTWDNYYNKTKTVDPLGHEVNYTYDGFGNLLTTKNGLGQTVATNTYTNRGQLASTTDGRGNVTGYTYDGYGFLTKTTDAAGKEWTKTYDEAGNILISTDPLSHTSSATYMSLNKPVDITDALGNVTGYTYDEMANLTSVTDANHNVTTYGWDQFQRKTSVTDALNNTTSFAYDAESNMTTLTDALGHSLGYTYDAVYKKKTFAFPDNRTESYEYDENENLTKSTNTAGQSITYGYDEADRMTNKTCGDGTVFTYSYDTADRTTGVTRVKNGSTESSIAYTLDAANRTTAVTQDGLTVGYGYDLSQNVNQISYPSGAVANYEYDSLNKLSAIKDVGNNTIVSYTKDDAGRITKETLGNGLESHYTYDANDRVTQIALKSSTNALQSFAYGYDAVGNRLWVQYKDGTGDVYKYDAIYQLVGVKYGVSNPQAGYDAATGATRTVFYAYDAVGNRTSVTENGNSSTYTVNNLNQYTAVSGTNFSYDNAGRLTSDGTWTYGYDYEGHLVSVAKAGTTVTYSYDTQGKRIGKSVNGVAAAKYVYNGNNLLEERDGTGNTVTAAYFYAGGTDQPVGVIKSGSAYYFQQDALGNVTSLTDASGSLVEQYSYDVYGKPTIKDGSGTIKTTAMTPFLFTGREYDSETGLYHYRARAYSPVIGRFLSRDPLKDAELGQGPNLYAYVKNNPANYCDPLGMDKEDKFRADYDGHKPAGSDPHVDRIDPYTKENKGRYNPDGSPRDGAPEIQKNEQKAFQKALDALKKLIETAGKLRLPLFIIPDPSLWGEGEDYYENFGKCPRGA